MANFIFAYHGGTTPRTPEDEAAVMAKWGAWMGAIEASLVDGGAPCGMSKTVNGNGIADNGGSNPISGYTIVKADSMDAACKLASGCPINEDPTGSVEVCECIEL